MIYRGLSGDIADARALITKVAIICDYHGLSGALVQNFRCFHYSIHDSLYYVHCTMHYTVHWAILYNILNAAL